MIRNFVFLFFLVLIYPGLSGVLFADEIKPENSKNLASAVLCDYYKEFNNSAAVSTHTIEHSFVDKSHSSKKLLVNYYAEYLK